jgi:lipopolysaccharide assembly outer membrane protein LptD (OstA)
MKSKNKVLTSVKTTPEAKVVNLSVARVASGGNAGHGQYFYSFDTNVIIINDPNTPLVFQLSKESASTFTILRLISSDFGNQLTIPVGSTDGRTLQSICLCKSDELIQVALLVCDRSDKENPREFVCDPQVLCVPRRPPIQE